MDHAIGADGLRHANGRGVVHDVMRTVDLLQRFADNLKDTAVTWVGAQDISEDEYITVCQHLDEMIHGLRAAFVSAQATYHALGTEARESPTAAAMAALLDVTTPLGEGFRPRSPRHDMHQGAAR